MFSSSVRILIAKVFTPIQSHQWMTGGQLEIVNPVGGKWAKAATESMRPSTIKEQQENPTN